MLSELKATFVNGSENNSRLVCRCIILIRGGATIFREGGQIENNGGSVPPPHISDGRQTVKILVDLFLVIYKKLFYFFVQ